MPPSRFSLSLIPGAFALCSLDPKTHLSELPGSFVSMTRTEHGLSLICLESVAPAGATIDPGWRVLALLLPVIAFIKDLDNYTPYDSTRDVGWNPGLRALSAIVSALGAANILHQVVGTSLTSYFLIKETDIEAAAKVLAKIDCRIHPSW